MKEQIPARAFICLELPSGTIQISAMRSVPVPQIILDTDMTSDVDDVGALAVLHGLANLGECQIIACVSNAHDQAKATAATIQVINTFYGNADIPIGTYHGPGFGPIGSLYTAGLRDEFPHSAPPDDRAPGAPEIYRQALAGATDGSVTIVSTGFLVNLRDLLRSNADGFSILTGMQLVRAKVCQLVVMGGQFPASDPNEGEFNFSKFDGGPVTREVVETWPTPILFSGYEIGRSIFTGGSRLAAVTGPNPVRRAFELFNGLTGRESWDEVTALAAVRAPALYWNIVADGYCEVACNGSNRWVSSPRGHSHLAAKVPDSIIAGVLDDLMTRPPRRSA